LLLTLKFIFDEWVPASIPTKFRILGGLIMARSTKSGNLYYLLQFLPSDGMLSASGIAELHAYMSKESILKEVIDLTKVKTRPDGRSYIYINRKQFNGADYPDLICKIYALYFGTRVTTLEELYPQWQIWRRDFT